MTILQFEDHMKNLVGCVCFSYNGYSCGVDPVGRMKYDIWYGNTAVTVDSVDAIMNTKIFNGKSLLDIWDDLTEFDY